MSRARIRAFTLIEVMVVVAILAVLAALIVPKVMSRPDEARVVAARYPTTEQGLAALVTRPTLAPVPSNWKPGGYLERLPRDPWGHAYQYLSPGLHGEIDVFSFGADGAAGGEGFDADIGSWNL
jgi:general secretion pathway protein G